MDTLHCEGRTRVDTAQARMSMVRADKGRLQHVRQPYVVDEFAAPAQEARILAAKHARADGFAAHPLPLPILSLSKDQTAADLRVRAFRCTEHWTFNSGVNGSSG